MPQPGRGQVEAGLSVRERAVILDGQRAGGRIGEFAKGQRIIRLLGVGRPQLSRR